MAIVGGGHSPAVQSGVLFATAPLWTRVCVLALGAWPGPNRADGGLCCQVCQTGRGVMVVMRGAEHLGWE